MSAWPGPLFGAFWVWWHARELHRSKRHLNWWQIKNIGLAFQVCLTEDLLWIKSLAKMPADKKKGFKEAGYQQQSRRVPRWRMCHTCGFLSHQFRCHGSWKMVAIFCLIFLQSSVFWRLLEINCFTAIIMNQPLQWWKTVFYLSYGCEQAICWAFYLQMFQQSSLT